MHTLSLSILVTVCVDHRVKLNLRLHSFYSRCLTPVLHVKQITRNECVVGSAGYPRRYYCSHGQMDERMLSRFCHPCRYPYEYLRGKLLPLSLYVEHMYEAWLWYYIMLWLSMTWYCVIDIWKLYSICLFLSLFPYKNWWKQSCWSWHMKVIL